MSNFGRPMLEHWLLDPGLTYLNHGTVGATPRRVLRRQWDIVEEIERQPAEYLLRRLADHGGNVWDGAPPLMRQAAASVADFVGADADGTVFVDNITTAANGVLRSIEFALGDTIAVTNHGYGGVTNVVRDTAHRSGANVHVIELPVAGAPRQDFVDAFEAQLQSNTRLLVVDHISSSSALVLPIDEIVAICRDKNVPVFVDGAHVPGQLDLNVASLGADWYGANLHKWAWTPRSSGFLWVAPEHRASTHPAVVSWGLGNGLTAEFDLPGTRDPSALLAVPEAFAMRAELGEAAIREHNHDLIWSAAHQLAEAWDVEFTTPREMVGSMTVVRLPSRFGSSAEAGQDIRRYLNDEARIELPVFSSEAAGGRCAVRDGLAVRVSTQIYNDAADIERLAAAVLAR